METPNDKLKNAALFTLGWIIAKEGFESNAAYFLASALKDSGVESVYVEAVLNKHAAKSALEPKASTP